MEIAKLANLFDRFDAVLADSAGLAEALNVRAARGDGRGGVTLFGAVAEAFHHWVARRLASIHPELAIVSDFEREALLVRTQGVDPGERDARWVRPLARLVRTYSGTPRWEGIREAGPPRSRLTAHEAERIAGLEAYYELLRAKGRIEPGDAAIVVARSLVEAGRATDAASEIAYVSDEPLPPIVRAFADALSRSEAFGLVHLAVDGRPWDGSAASELPRASEPGRYVLRSPRSPREQLTQARRDILRYVERGPVVVCAKDPTAAYEALAPLLATGDDGPAQGRLPLRVLLRTRGRFDEDAFGRHFLAERNVLRGTRDLRFGDARSPRDLPWDKASQIDVLAYDRLAPSHGFLWNTDADWRRRLLIGKERAWESLGPSESQPATDATVDATGATGLDGEDPGRAQWLERWTNSERAVEEARSFLATLDWKDDSAIDAVLISLFRDGRVGRPSATYDAAAGERPDVEFCGLYEAAGPAVDPPAALIALDLDADSLPVADREGAFEALVRNLELPSEDSARRRERLWHRLLSQATDVTVLSCPRRDESGRDLRPSEFLADLVETLDSQDAVGGKSTTRPSAGGGDGTVDGLAALAETLWPPSLVELSPMPPSTSPDYVVGSSRAWNRQLMSTSPKEIRTYLECPRKWFWNCQLDTYGLDHTADVAARSKYLRDAITAYTARREGAGIDLRSPAVRDVMVEARTAVREAYRATDLDGSPEDVLFPRYLSLPDSPEMADLWQADGWLDAWPAFEAGYLRPSASDGPPPAFRRRYTCREVHRDGEIPYWYLQRIYGALAGGNQTAFSLQPFRVDVCESEGSYLVTVLEGSLWAISLVDPAEGGGAPDRPDVAALPPSMVEYCAFLRLMGGVVQVPPGWSVADFKPPRRPAGIVIVSTRGEHPVKGFCDRESAFLTATELGEREGIVAVESNLFHRTLEEVGRFALREFVEPARRGEIPRRPRSAGACAYCGDRLCPMRRSHD